MAKQALIVWGGYEPHQPKEVAELFRGMLEQDGFEVRVSDSLEPFADVAMLKQLDLIVPCWTCGKLTPEQSKGVSEAVKSGVGLAGVHGGMGDAFRNDTTWQFMTGGQFVAHPGNDSTRYTVTPTTIDSPITDGVGEFEVSSEQYYMHVDPALRVLMTTHFPVADGPHVGNGPCEMPVVWTKLWGKGRVFYNALGHVVNVLETEPVPTINRRGFLWAAEGKASSR
ncbi:MAG TPA: ThuA domain-containing protein [Tepidisphaeraceae bacterium]|nr:ThuA domain-containing protein [Tepidisphaeraceae bacterium]